jgi:hypothetical protein
VVIGNSTSYYHLARTFLASLAPDYYCMFDAQNKVLQKLTALEAHSRSYDKAWLPSQLQSPELNCQTLKQDFMRPISGVTWQLQTRA